MLLTIGGLKGGLGKSTTAWFLGTGLAQLGRTLLVDADPASQSLITWAQKALDAGYELPFDVQPWSGPTLLRNLRHVAPDFDHIVIDSGGETARQFIHACMFTGQLLIPCGPFVAEMERLPATFAAAAEAEAEAGEVVTARILLVRVDKRARDGANARTYLTGMGLPVMDAIVRRSAPDYARAPGHVPIGLGDYDAVLAELLSTVNADAAGAGAGLTIEAS